MCKLHILVAAGMTVISLPLAGQTYTCHPASSEVSTALRDYVVQIVTGTNASVVNVRNTYQLLSATAGQVTLVTQKNTCKNAALAYHAALNPPGTPAISRSMIVIKISNSRYVIEDPTEVQGEYKMVMVTDASFNVLAKFSS